MEGRRTSRGFGLVEHPQYGGEHEGVPTRLVQESSLIGDYDEGMEKRRRNRQPDV